MSNNRRPRVGWLLIGDKTYGSSRIQGFNIHHYLVETGWTSEILRAPKIPCHRLDLDIKNYLRLVFGRYDVVVFQKVFDTTAIRLARLLRLINIKTIFILCDRHKTEIIKAVDLIVVSSQQLRDFVEAEFGYRPLIIDDAIEIKAGVRAPLVDRAKPRAIWVGSKDNWAPMEKLTTLISQSCLAGKFEIVTVSDHPKATINWSLENVVSQCLHSDFALIPTESTPWAKAKSTNRLAMFLAIGLPVVASEIPAYRDLSSQTGGVVFADTDNDWLYQIKNMCNLKFRAATQGNAADEVRKLLDISVIGEKWLSAIHSLLARPT